MTQISCSYCNAPIAVSDGFTTGEISCPSCGQSFFVDPEPADEPTPAPVAAPSRPMPRPNRPIPPPKRQAPSRQAAVRSAADVVAESKRIVLPWFAVLEGTALVLGVFYGLTGATFFLWLACLSAGLFPLWFMVWVMIYVRTIAINTER